MLRDPARLAVLRQRRDAVALTEALLAGHGEPVRRDLHEALVRNAEVVRVQVVQMFGYVPEDPKAFAASVHAV